MGVEALDADHRCLLRIVNLLQGIRTEDTSRRTIQTVLDTLKLYGRMHFRREERVMDAIGFPGNEFHRAEHRGFARYIESLRAGSAKQSRPQLVGTLSDYLTGWLRHHILIQDMAYKPYVNDLEFADKVARGAAPPLPNVIGLSRDL